MKRILGTGIMLVTLASMALAAPIRVVVLGFDDDTGMASDAKLGGAINTQLLAKKGAAYMMKQLVGAGNFEIVDQRDFMAQMAKRRLDDEGKSTSLKPAYLDAARALNADVLLRGSLTSFSTGKQIVNQGGYKTTMANVSLTVSLQAQDVADGGVISMGMGSASRQFRQTDASQTELSEGDVLGLLNEAMAAAAADMTKSVTKKIEELAKRPRIKLSFATTDDPAMVEIDGVLVGTTPLQNLEVYKGDHLLHISRPGYESITKRINLTTDASIRVPMLRTDLTADERKEILQSADLKAYLMNGKPDLVIQEIE